MTTPPADLRRHRSRRRGAAMIEMGLMLPVLIFTFAVVLELSFFMSQMHMVARAARDGARVGSITIEGPDADGSEITANAIDQAELVLTAGGYECSTGCDIDAVWELDADTGYNFITVTVNYPYQSFTTVIPELSNIIRSDFTMMTQQQ